MDNPVDSIKDALSNMKRPKKKQLDIVKEEKVDDRSAYNCQNCQGEGLVKVGMNLLKCPACNGTGKV